ncbi:MAG: MFS transporter [Minwuia sp.]|uniref:MFS transporter n=1 Tax=Minwuia sp. TaxID=2493630 RepID=UPI003A874D05
MTQQHETTFPNTALGVTLVLQSVAAVIFMSAAVLAPALPPELGLDEAGIGLFGGVTFAGAMFGSPLAAVFIRQQGAVRLTQAGLLLSVAGLMALLLQNWWIALAGALLIGLGYGPNAPGGSHLLARHAPPARRGLYFSIKQSGVPIGGAIAGLSLPLIEETFGWMSAVLAVLALTAVTIFIVQPWRARLDPERDLPRQPVRVRFGDIIPLEGMKSHPLLPFISFTAFAYGGGQMIMFTYTVIFLTGQAGFTLVDAGVAYAVMQGSSFAMRILAGWINDRWRRPRPLLAGFGLVTAVGVTLLASIGPDTSWMAVLAIAALCGAAAAGWNGVYLAEVARIVPQEKIAAATGATVFCTYFGLVIGPAVFGAAVQAGGYGLAYGGLAGLALIGAAAVFARKAV